LGGAELLDEAANAPLGSPGAKGTRAPRFRRNGDVDRDDCCGRFPVAQDHDPLAVVLGRIDDLGEMRLGMSERRLPHMTIMTISPPPRNVDRGMHVLIGASMRISSIGFCDMGSTASSQPARVA